MAQNGAMKPVFSRIWRTPEKDGIAGVAVVGRVRAVRYGWDARDHYHPGILEIGFCISGLLTLYSEGREHCVMPGNIFVNRPTEKHHLGVLPKGAQYYVLHLRLSELRRGKHFLGLSPEVTGKVRQRLSEMPSCLHVNAVAVHDAFRRLIKSLYKQQDDCMTQLAVMGRCLDLIDALCRLDAPKIPEWKKLRIAKLVNLMDRSPRRIYSVQELLRVSGMTLTVFKQAFSAVVGLPAKQYQQMRRLAEAKRLLETTSASETAVADSLGFSSVQHFSSQFGKWYGMPPSAVRVNENQQRRR